MLLMEMCYYVVQLVHVCDDERKAKSGKISGACVPLIL
jgi:hypothetical protein